MSLSSFFVKFLPYLMVFQSGESSEESSSSKLFKTKFKLLGWLFGNPLEKFDNLVITPSTSESSSTDIPWPTEQNVMQLWMHLVDEKRDSLHVAYDFYSSITWDIVDNLVAFWELYSTNELR